jgi:hypothetical protein
MSTEGPAERHNARPAAGRRRVTGGVVDRKTRMVGIITRWVVFVSCLMPWGIILAWLASRFAAQ